MNNSENSIGMPKPSTVKALKIIAIIRLLIVVVFYVIFTIKDIQIGDVGPQVIMYTGITFAVLLIPILYFLHQRKMVPLRILLVLDLLAAIPASAFISIVLSTVCLILTFTKSFKEYFEA